MDQIELVTALIAAAAQNYSSSINAQKGQLEQDRLLVTVKDQMQR